MTASHAADHLDVVVVGAGQAGLTVSYYPWLSNRGSGLLYGVAADSARIAQHIAAAASGAVRPGGRLAATA